MSVCFPSGRVDLEAVIMQSPTSRRALLNYIGVLILLAGMGAGEFIYWRSLQGGSGTDAEDPLLSQYDSRVYQRDVRMYVGTFGLIMNQWSRAAAKLGEPRPLAITITVLSMLAAGGCFMVASRMRRD
jgi:hypothetical protein